MAIKRSQLSPPDLYDTSARICRENAITMDCSYCQECGELYYQGFLVRATGQRGAEEFYASNEAAFGNSVVERLLIHFPRAGVEYGHDREWAEFFFNGFTGKLSNNPKHKTDEKWAHVRIWGPLPQQNDNEFWLPTECPHCEANWSAKEVGSPIRAMGTGYGKFSQIIVEQLFDVLKSKQEIHPKLVAFSDSRKDAAILAADLELNHYRDSARAISESILLSFSGPDPDLLDFVNRCKEMTADELLEHPFMKTHQREATQIRKLVKGQLKEKTSEHREATLLTRQAGRKWIPFRSESENSLVKRVLKDLIHKGFNPAGIHESRLFPLLAGSLHYITAKYGSCKTRPARGCRRRFHFDSLEKFTRNYRQLNGP
ncbi:MAG: hypothetical protein IPK68_22610 [Bdellovibrionales bacterium]|nr:hypothetical protein [Bdellovibrionales bacterium]